MKKTAVVDRGICVACGVCMKTCPRGAVTVWRGCYALVDEKRCVGCGLCAGACPAGCIETRERSGANEKALVCVSLDLDGPVFCPGVF